jgi:PPM family protein phosphatase
MLRVSEQYAATDTGRQRRANEDSLLARSPLFVVADGMGGAQAGEVASRIAVESFHDGLGDTTSPEDSLAVQARAANARIYELAQSNSEQAGMGTTLTAVYVGEQEVAIAHVGDSRAYCLRDSELLRLTDDHSLVDELIREGRLTPEEAEEHPQRSIITRALGPEETVEVDTRSFRARPGDLFLLCSDGLTSMVSEARLAELLRANPRLSNAGEALIAEANAAGGRDNITVILLRLEEVDLSPPSSDGPAGRAEADRGELDQQTTRISVPIVTAPRDGGGAQTLAELTAVGGGTATSATVIPRRPRRPPAQPAAGTHRRGRLRGLLPALAVLTVVGLLLTGAYLASQSVYFIGTDSRGLVTMFQGFPYELPGSIKLYSSYYVTGVSAATLSPGLRRTLLDHSLHTEAKAGSLLHSLELGELSE